MGLVRARLFERCGRELAETETKTPCEGDTFFNFCLRAIRLKRGEEKTPAKGRKYWQPSLARTLPTGDGRVLVTSSIYPHRERERRERSHEDVTKRTEGLRGDRKTGLTSCDRSDFAGQLLQSKSTRESQQERFLSQGEMYKLDKG